MVRIIAYPPGFVKDFFRPGKRRRAEAKARIDEIVKKMPKRLLKAFPSLSSRRNPDSVPLVRESMEKEEDKTMRDAAKEHPVQQECEEQTCTPQDNTPDKE